MDSVIALSFRYQEQDYVRALRAHYRSRLRWRTDLAFIIGLSVMGLWLWRSPEEKAFGILCVVAAAVLALMLALAFTVIPPWAFRREPKYRDEYHLKFSEEGIRFHTVHVDSQLQWSLYSRALIDAHSYVLYYGERQFTIIPTRVFPSEAQRGEFEALLTRHISQIERKGP